MNCPVCGEELVPSAEDGAGGGPESVCPACEVRVVGALEETVQAGKETRPLSRFSLASDPGPATTLFQPGIMLSSILEDSEDRPAARPREPFELADGGAGPPPLPDLPLRLEAELYFLVLGAEPGRERLSLHRARTVLGRAGADLVLDDPEISDRHCQIDVMGRELFVRDLESRGGTFLNGHRIRYSELLPGDEIRLGNTVLVFRASDDGLGQRRQHEET